MVPLIIIAVVALLAVLLLVSRSGPQDSATRSALVRIEAKLDLLLKHANLTYDPLASMPLAVRDAISRGKRIEAIKLYRQATGIGLKEAMDLVDRVPR